MGCRGRGRFGRVADFWPRCAGVESAVLRRSRSGILRRGWAAVDVNGVGNVVSMVHVLKNGCFTIQLSHTHVQNLSWAWAAKTKEHGERRDGTEGKHLAFDISFATMLAATVAHFIP